MSKSGLFLFQLPHPDEIAELGLLKVKPGVASQKPQSLQLIEEHRPLSGRPQTG